MKKLLLTTFLLISFVTLSGCTNNNVVEELKHEVTIYMNDGNAPETNTVIEGDLFDQPSDPILTGYTFLGWYSDSKFETEHDFDTPITSKTKIYVKWEHNEYTLTFRNHSGDIYAESAYHYNDSISIYEVNEREGYTFGGWFTDFYYTERFYETKMPDSDLVLYAKWEVNVHEINIVADGVVVDTLQYRYGELITKTSLLASNIPEKDGYYAFDFEEDIPPTMPDSDLTFNVRYWAVEYNIIYKSNGGTEVTPSTFSAENPAIAPENPTHPEYEFIGWYLDPYLVNPVDFDSLDYDNVTLYAKWDNHYLNYGIPKNYMGESAKNAYPAFLELVVAELNNQGYDFDDIYIHYIDTSDEVGMLLEQGYLDFAYMYFMDYKVYESRTNLDFVVASAVNQLNKSYDNPKDWNNDIEVIKTENLTSYFNFLVVTGTSEDAISVTQKVNQGTTLVWEDISHLKICTQSKFSLSYAYFNYWVQSNFIGKKASDLLNHTEENDYEDIMKYLSDGTCDVGVVIDFMLDFSKDNWTNPEEYNRTLELHEEINVIGISEKLYNNAVVMKSGYDRSLLSALQNAYINVGSTDTSNLVHGDDLNLFAGFIVIEDENYELFNTVMRNNR